MGKITTLGGVSLILAGLLLLCFAPMPYGYFMLIRIVTVVVMCCIAVQAIGAEKTALCVMAVTVAILFQPLIKIPLGRTVWNAVDLLVAVWLIILVIRKQI